VRGSTISEGGKSLPVRGGSDRDIYVISDSDSNSNLVIVATAVMIAWKGGWRRWRLSDLILILASWVEVRETAIVIVIIAMLEVWTANIACKREPNGMEWNQGHGWENTSYFFLVLALKSTSPSISHMNLSITS
jgi:hypothetical protein